VARIGRAPGGGVDPLGPPRGVLVFLRGEPEQDVPALQIGFALGEQFVRVRGFDFAPPHLLHRGEIDLVDRHGYPMSFSKAMIVKMPVAMRITCRAALASIWPRCRSGIRSDIAI